MGMVAQLKPCVTAYAIINSFFYFICDTNRLSTNYFQIEKYGSDPFNISYEALMKLCKFLECKSVFTSVVYVCQDNNSDEIFKYLGAQFQVG